MSTISTLIAQARAFVTTLRSSIWAIDVRDGIGDSIQKLSEAIEQCYSDVSNPTLQTEALEAALQNKIDEGEMAALTIGDGTITGAKLANGTIPKAKLDPSITFDADDELDNTSTNAIQNKVVAAEFSAINESLGNLEDSLQSQTGIISKIEGSYINLTTDPVSLTPVVNALWAHSIVSCAEGDKFIINADGGQSPRAWGFLDSSNHVLSVADASTVVEDLELTAPANAVKLIINDRSGAVSYISSAYLLTKIAESAQGKVDVQQSPSDYGKALVINRDGQVRPGVVSGGSGLTDSVKVALLACFRHVLWGDEHGNEYYNALEASLYAAESRLTAVIDYGNTTIFADDPLSKVKWMLKVYYDGVEIPPQDYTLTGDMIAGQNVLTITYNDESTSIMVEAEEKTANRLVLTAGDLLKFTGLGMSSSADGHMPPYLVSRNNARTYYVAKGHAPYRDVNNDVLSGIYPIPIPADATHVKVSVAPNEYKLALNCWRYNNSTYNYSVISGTDTGFRVHYAETDIPQSTGNARALNFAIMNQNETTLDASTEPTQVVVQFT